MIDVVDRQVELRVVFFSTSTILGATIGQNSQHRKLVMQEKRQYPAFRRSAGVIGVLVL
jgi:hypothetical protein